MRERARTLMNVRHSLRRRVALTFTAAVAMTALAMALSAYFITKTTQDEEALEKALAQSRFNLFLADSVLPETPNGADYDRLLDALQIRGDFATLIEAGDELYVSGPQVTEGLVTPELAAKIGEGRIGYQMITMAGEQTIAVGGQVRSSELTFYNFYPQGARLAELHRLRNILIVAGLVLALLGAIAGYWLARRLTGPVRDASKAAVQMSQGDLDIRLPEGGDEFGVLGASFNRMAENLRTKMLDLEAGQARERRFVADVTHELRTPVAALVGETSLLKARLDRDSGGCPPEISRLALMVNEDISRLRQLVDELLEISRLEAQAAETVIETVELETFLAQLVDAHGWSASVRLVRDAIGPAGAGSPGESSAADTLRTDKRRLERIVVNLVENALLHGAKPVTIETGWEPEVETGGAPSVGRVVRVAVTDNGAGIAEEHLSHVFDRFYKADPSRSASRGSGLGLAIARENARLLGGDLTVANIPGGGARFVLQLPA
jgi:two-component system sensor histidine kinase MtrB